MHVDWSKAFEYEKFRVLHVKQIIWEEPRLCWTYQNAGVLDSKEKTYEP